MAPVGAWTVSGGSAKTAPCGTSASAMVINADDSEKSDVVAMWQPSPNMAGAKVEFVATVVKDGQVYWSNVKSAELQLAVATASGIPAAAPPLSSRVISAANASATVNVTTVSSIKPIGGASGSSSGNVSSSTPTNIVSRTGQDLDARNPMGEAKSAASGNSTAELSSRAPESAGSSLMALVALVSVIISLWMS